MDQRQRTLRKVTQSIVKFQREFLDKGLTHLRPLSLRDVGEDIGMHESTISRVTTNKYVETPQGLFELKFFFHSGIASGDGEMVSSVSVKKMIQDHLANEDPAKPLSDQEVAQVLKGRGLVIARRTVAKYRDELGILPRDQRRLRPGAVKPPGPAAGAPVPVNPERRGVVLTPDFKALAKRKITRLTRVLPHILDARVVATAEKFRRAVRITLRARRRTFASEATAGDLTAAFDEAVEALKRQTREAKERRTLSKGRATRRGVGDGLIEPVA